MEIPEEDQRRRGGGGSGGGGGTGGISASNYIENNDIVSRQHLDWLI